MVYCIAVFIDGGYVDQILKSDHKGAKIDFAALSNAVTKRIHPDAELLRTYYYHCLPYKGSNPTQDERARFATAQNFHAALNALPRFVVKEGRLARRGTSGKYYYQQKMVDTLLSIDLVQVSLKGKVTHVVVVAGDSDFVPAIEVAKNESIAVWLLHGQRIHSSLRDVADERIELDLAFINRIRWKGKR